MPRPSRRSRSFRKVWKKLPGGRLKIAFSRRKPSKATCPVYQTPLSGVPRGNPSKIKKLSRSKRRPERPYGGVLSSRAMRELMIARARGK